jgi:hypothetical protein
MHEQISQEDRERYNKDLTANMEKRMPCAHQFSDKDRFCILECFFAEVCRPKNKIAESAEP